MEFIKLLAERQAFVFTRGFETANFLQGQGVYNANASGCPSMFHLSSNVIKAWKYINRVRVDSTSRLVFSGYLGEETEYETTRDINALIDSGGHSSYVLQDEMVNYGLTIEGDDESIVYDVATGRITGPLGFPHQEKIRCRLDMHCFFDSSQWRAWISHADFALQRRFHGSIVALQAGVPSIMIALDDRMREMLNFIGFPYFEREDWIHADKRSCLNALLSELDTDAIVGRYVEREASFRSLLRQAGLA